MVRHDLNFPTEVEEFILSRAEELRSRHSFIQEEIVLLNVLRVERKDRFGNVTGETGPYVSVGLTRSCDGLDEALLPTSGKIIYLNGFEQEVDIVLKLCPGTQGKSGRIIIYQR